MTDPVVIGDCTLYCGDALDVLPTLPAVSAVITDPPYGIALTSHGHWFRRAKPVAGDANLKLARHVYRWCRSSRTPLAMFYSPFRPLRAKWRTVLVWNKGGHVGIGGDHKTCWKRDFELIGVAFNHPLNGKRDSAVLQVPALLPPPSGHVAEKPARLVRYLIEKLTQPGDTVLDPFAGSFTTAVACVQTGRKFVGCELDESYFAVGVRRVEEAWGKHGLFAGA
jgi:site-specific DNA-methyltransferase (adenine-specific)